jgi:hypothetical protein
LQKRTPPDRRSRRSGTSSKSISVYNSTTVRYSCGNLQRRIAQILQAVGAHASMGVEIGCNSGELVRYSNVHLTLAVPVEATEENLRAATNFDTRDELVARLHQTGAAKRGADRALSRELANCRSDAQPARYRLGPAIAICCAPCATTCFLACTYASCRADCVAVVAPIRASRRGSTSTR